MRIAYILTTLGVGGAEKQTVALAERMAARGHAVTLISLTHAEEECSAHLPILRLNMAKTPLGIMRGLQFADKFMTLFRPDILHSHTYPANMFGRLLRLFTIRRQSRAAVINTIHNVYEGGWHRKLIYRVTAPLAVCVTAVSTAAAESYPAARGKVRVVTNGVDVEAFSPDKSRRRRVRMNMQASNRFIWLAVGRLAPAKDYPNLLRAWAQVHSSDREARLWIAGEGEIADVITQDDVMDLAAGYNSGVEWLGLRRDVADLLDAADGYVLSSAWEGMPLAVGEAMAMQKLVVATDVGGVRELGGDEAFIVPAHDSAALASEMLRVMAMEEFERRTIGKRARGRMQDNFSMDAKADEWELLYEEVSRLVAE